MSVSRVLWIPGRPVAYPRAMSKGRQRYMPQRYRDWLEQAAWTLKAEWEGPTWTEGVRVEAQVLEDAVRVVVQEWPTERGKLQGDIDNYGKSVLDSLQYARVIGDDRQVQDCRFYFGEHE